MKRIPANDKQYKLTVTSTQQPHGQQADLTQSNIAPVPLTAGWGQRTSLNRHQGKHLACAQVCHTHTNWWKTVASETKNIDERQRGILKGILEQKTGESEENSRKD